ncbi:hypothetical protein BDV93DRAFT_514826 [Ceratobasidium sp. AG-I]|nr:hypothetical protein BDV93DRAFT_514826 [Ceratobasidium sp. AG-I]
MAGAAARFAYREMMEIAGMLGHVTTLGLDNDGRSLGHRKGTNHPSGIQNQVESPWPVRGRENTGEMNKQPTMLCQQICGNHDDPVRNQIRYTSRPALLLYRPLKRSIANFLSQPPMRWLLDEVYSTPIVPNAQMRIRGGGCCRERIKNVQRAVSSDCGERRMIPRNVTHPPGFLLDEETGLIAESPNSISLLLFLLDCSWATSSWLKFNFELG